MFFLIRRTTKEAIQKQQSQLNDWVAWFLGDNY